MTLLVLNLEADLTVDDDLHLLNEITQHGKRAFHMLKIALPFSRMQVLASKDKMKGITFGVPHLNDALPGSFTEKIAASMVKNAGACFTLIGTIKERKRLNENSVESLSAKMKNALDSKLEVIYCIDLSSDLQQQLELLLQYPAYFNQKEPLLIIQPLTTFYKHYLPSSEELKEIYAQVEGPLKESLGDHFKNISLLVKLPADLAGFSEVIAKSPFQGIFCNVSGIYPHSVHEEFAGLAKADLEN